MTGVRNIPPRGFSSHQENINNQVFAVFGHYPVGVQSFELAIHPIPRECGGTVHYNSVGCHGTNQRYSRNPSLVHQLYNWGNRSPISIQERNDGGYELGYADVDDFGLAKAMAISAAFPGGIGPLTLKTKKFQWKKRKHWDAPESESYQQPFSCLHLYDGGLYDNLGLEPMFDVGLQSIKEDESLPSKITYLLVSDGGSQLARENIPHPLNPLRFKRIANIALDQCGALRIRSFVNFLKNIQRLGCTLESEYLH